jgi:glycine cleavage system regulatory protein
MEVMYVVTLFGVDQPGVIEAISNTAAGLGASWQESQMTRLAGRFSGIICIRCSEANAEALEDGLLALNRDGLELRVERSSENQQVQESFALCVELVGHDRPGILGELSGALAARKVNIVDLQTECQSAPMSAELLFLARAELLCPTSLSIEQLRDTLEDLGENLMVDINIDIDDIDEMKTS